MFSGKKLIATGAVLLGLAMLLLADVIHDAAEIGDLNVAKDLLAQNPKLVNAKGDITIHRCIWRQGTAIRIWSNF